MQNLTSFVTYQDKEEFVKFLNQEMETEFSNGRFREFYKVIYLNTLNTDNSIRNDQGNYLYIPLKQSPFRIKMELLKWHLEKYKERKIYLVINDISDFVTSVNYECEAVELTTMLLNNLNAESKLCVCMAIRQNKATGHLGCFIEKKFDKKQTFEDGKLKKEWAII